MRLGDPFRVQYWLVVTSLHRTNITANSSAPGLELLFGSGRRRGEDNGSRPSLSRDGRRGLGTDIEEGVDKLDEELTTREVAGALFREEESGDVNERRG
jgi:hypothetical protein